MKCVPSSKWELLLRSATSSREKIELELAKVSDDMLDVYDKHLISSAALGRSKIFYLKRCIFFHHYLFTLATDKVLSPFISVFYSTSPYSDMRHLTRLLLPCQVGLLTTYMPGSTHSQIQYRGLLYVLYACLLLYLVLVLRRIML